MTDSNRIIEIVKSGLFLLYLWSIYFLNHSGVVWVYIFGLLANIDTICACILWFTDNFIENTGKVLEYYKKLFQNINANDLQPSNPRTMDKKRYTIMQENITLAKSLFGQRKKLNRYDFLSKNGVKSIVLVVYFLGVCVVELFFMSKLIWQTHWQRYINDNMRLMSYVQQANEQDSRDFGGKFIRCGTETVVWSFNMFYICYGYYHMVMLGKQNYDWFFGSDSTRQKRSLKPKRA